MSKTFQTSKFFWAINPINRMFVFALPVKIETEVTAVNKIMRNCYQCYLVVINWQTENRKSSCEKINFLCSNP